MDDPTTESERAAIIDEIGRAFDTVRRDYVPQNPETPLRWQDLTDEQVRARRYALPYLEPRKFRFYLPALLTYALRHSEGDAFDRMFGDILDAIDPRPWWRQLVESVPLLVPFALVTALWDLLARALNPRHMTRAQQQQRRFGLLNDPQRQAVLHVLQFFSHHGSRDVRREAQAILRHCSK